jgi:hypothetical protein
MRTLADYEGRDTAEIERIGRFDIRVASVYDQQV